MDFCGTKFLCTCHHAKRVDVVEQKILVHLSSHDEGGCCGTKNSCGPDLSSCDDGGRLGNKKFFCTCHQMMRVFVLRTKSSGDDPSTCF